MQQYCAERYEQPHIMNIRAGCKASNHNLNYLPQVVTVQCHILCFPIREINLEAIVKQWENRIAACNVLPSDGDLATPQSSQA
jgi:hypothetical protein